MPVIPHPPASHAYIKTNSAVVIPSSAKTIEQREAELKAAAVRGARTAIKVRVRRFILDPDSLEFLKLGLSFATPRGQIAYGKRMLEADILNPRPMCGFGGEVPALNAKALIWLGRYRRFVEARALAAAE